LVVVAERWARGLLEDTDVLVAVDRDAEDLAPGERVGQVGLAAQMGSVE
jgi:hypothetical protein